MTIRSLLAGLVLASAAFATTPLRAQDAAADLKALVNQIQDKLKQGQRSAEQLAPELAAFDALIEKYKGQKSEEVAQMAFMRATLYLQVLNDADKGKALLDQVKSDFPGTKAAANVERTLAALERNAKAKQAQSELVGKPAPEIAFTWSSDGKLKKLSDLKGKVVVLDFWATWCGPCISSFPQVRQLVEHYKDADVVVLGVTSIQGRVMNLEPSPIDTRGNPEKEMNLMPQFMKAKDMTWTVVFSEQNVFNEDYGVNGIPHMTIIAPDGTVRHNDLHPAQPHDEKVAKIDALLKEFSLKVPNAKKA